MKSLILIVVLSWVYICTAQNTSYTPYYDTTWAGPVQLARTFNASSNTSGFELVQATLVMPHLALPKRPHQQVDEYTASFWIGLDGFLLSGSDPVRGLWQAGVVMSIFTNGTTSYSGFYEWVPNDPVSLTTSQLAISEDDHIRVAISTTDSGYRGTTKIMNLNTSQSFEFSQDAPTAWRGPKFPAPGSSAEWIIEAGTYLNTTQYVFPDWGNASILDARACYAVGKCVVPGDVDAGDDSTRMTAVLWNDTQIVYTKSYVDEEKVWIEYVEEPFE